ncbi:abc transporter, permease protein, putative [Heliomicrobium modesticaldum Ice1]|uniref:Abc transporter, permease protein, putative n=1 Tax=Heliobacterium modesticaldum (strain ATCC 51547 / Ice1) TaxID=498761 RepID=B0TA74_HELMI|nr:permease [Heliomicrobium modesticaldum]ABZ83611.1 abc transporter, permease protein, putative [Heliomicrobium modesticaldum Ice1]
MTVLVMRVRHLVIQQAWLVSVLAALSLVAAAAWLALRSEGGAVPLLFMGILLEALPFLLLGVIVSSLVEVFISPDGLRRLLPTKPWAAILTASSLGIIFPFCECGIIPVVRRLVRKGMPLYAGMAFLLAAPIVNPIVIASTATAFRGHEEMVLGRLIGAMLVAWLTALVFLFWRGDGIRGEEDSGSHGAGTSCCGHSQGRLDHHAHLRSGVYGHGRFGWLAKWRQAADHAVDEFFDLGPYFLTGALIAAVMQGMLQPDWLTEVARDSGQSTLIMMLLAYGLSVCSNADAFLASAMAPGFSGGSVLAFMILGPMLDMKNTWVLFRTFRPAVVCFLLGWLPLLVFLFAWVVNGRIMAM